MINHYFISQQQGYTIERDLNINMDNDDEVATNCLNCDCKFVFQGLKEGIRRIVNNNVNQLLKENQELKQKVADLEMELKGCMQEAGDIPYDDDIFNKEREEVINGQNFEICPICENNYPIGGHHSC